ncbi:MAG: methionine--tRNA ligase [Flavobacteriales bacterium]|nr:methionine--tRNA ligase [Flavobacteriales bacterium]|tara:strand:+ start:9124 stop:10809 length:1686 start_codon:yes stop_codon:yes gene_type:complete
MTKKRYTITSALPYANGPLHIGHIAGAYLPADIYVRYRKSKKDDVLFICGSDEHGAAITLRAKKEGLSPKDIVDTYHFLNEKSFANFGINFDVYHRTSDPTHHQTAQDFFKTLDQKGLFKKIISNQFYDEENQQFLADRYIVGTCPKCGSDKAYGDQCEKCGATLSPNDLINPKSTLSGNTPIMKETMHWYLPMQDHENWLRDWIEKGVYKNKKLHNPKDWRHQVIGQCKSWINGGLRERAMTRDLNWGVKVPYEDVDGKVLYVWLDAPIGYISATQKWADENNKNWECYWQNDAELIHFIGKDNIVFHTIIFPIILHALGDFVLPKNVPANEFLNLEGQKLSTSRNWAIWLDDYLKDFVDQQDVLRYVLCSTAPESKDTDFTWIDFQTRNNSELVAIFGNFINRVVVLTNKYWGGYVPKKNNLTQSDKRVLETLTKYAYKVGQLIEKYKFREALSEVMNLARLGNKYLADTEPWKLKKIDEKRTQTILNIALQIAVHLSVFSEPFLPFTSEKLCSMLNIEKGSWDNIEELHNNHKINSASLLFSKIEDEVIDKQLLKLKS